jgi:non-heme chloroperoxidase
MQTSFVQAGPVRLQYFTHGDGPQTVVLVHGYTASGRIWRLVQEALDPARYRTIAFSNRGAGDSDHTGQPADFTVEGFAGDLAAAVQALGLSRFALVGHSMGGATVAQFALDHPEALQALVLLDPAPLIGRGLEPNWEERVRERYRARLVADRPGPARGRSVPADFQAALDADIARNPLERYLGGRQSMAGLQLRGRLVELTQPVLVVGGDQDTLVGVDNILAEYLALPPARRFLQVFHGVGHSPNVEVAGDLTAVLDRFFREHAGTAS